MAMPLRAAVLALCLFALAGSAAAAACTDQGTFKADLIATSAGDEIDPIAKCLSSFSVTLTTVATDCQVTVLPLAAADNYVTGMWGAAAIEEKLECPSTMRDFTLVTGTEEAAIATAISIHIYGVEVAGSGVGTVALTAGVATLTRGAVVLTYAITQSTYTPATVSTTVIEPSVHCSNGFYGVMIGEMKLCALCPAGTFSDDGVGCTPCPAGKYVDSVGASDVSQCSACSAGTYAQGGNSDCLLCPAGTYSDAAAQGSCKVCESNSWSLYPGMTACLKCVNGVPTTTVNAGILPSGGYHVLEIASAGDTASLKTSCASLVKPVLTTRCSMTPATTKLSVFVDFDCSVTIQPIMDPTCAELGADTPVYADTLIHGYYSDLNTIKTLLPTTGDSTKSTSYLLTLGGAVNDALTLTFSSATNDPADADISPTVCTGTVLVTGGLVASSDPATGCPAGSYVDDVDAGCSPCPTGKTCALGDVATDCLTDTFQPLLGAAGTCTTCNPNAAPRYTSNVGADYCTVPYVDTECGDGQEYDDSVGECVDCAAGYKRDSAVDATCVPCAAGESTVDRTGETTCTACASGEVAPVEGMAECTTCPVGSIPVSGTSCSLCGPGTVQNGLICTACDADLYRSGDATPENNVCKKIPAGYKEKTGAGVDARSEIALCDKGEFSAWETGSRVPAAAPTTCAACTGNTYAPRTGMQKCLACKAGFKPALDKASCTACPTGDYRPAFDTTDSCTTCPAGSEVGPSNRAACTPCRPGYFNDASPVADECEACDGHTYQPKSGQKVCVDCPKGTEGTDVGIANTECSPCAKGFYNNVPASACLPAPAGTFVNITRATSFTACQVGTFSAEAGSDTCDSCPPGQYANTRGSKTCKTCPAGTFSAGRASSCVSCKPGYYSATGSGACSPCKPGSYSASLRSTTCSLCPIGKQCPLIATAAPQSCGKGYFSNKGGARLCAPCPINTYQPNTSSKQCLACPVGTNTRGRMGQSACQVVRTRTLRLSMF